jgi:hypothetical protein
MRVKIKVKLSSLTRIIFEPSRTQGKLTDLEAETNTVRAEEDILIDARIDFSKPEGTARGQPSTQYRLRIKGQKARYLKPAEVARTRAAIARVLLSLTSSIGWKTLLKPQMLAFQPMSMWTTKRIVW